MSSQELQTLQWQFDLAWRLAMTHLPALTDAACLWEPGPGCWTVRRRSDGAWRPDWAEEEPDPAPPATIGWLTWQIIWWWSGALASMRGEAAPSHEKINWPGTAEAAAQRIGALSDEWSNMLSELNDDDLERPSSFPWREPRPLRIMLAWANSELMKNSAEIGYARHLFEASQRKASATIMSASKFRARHE